MDLKIVLILIAGAALLFYRFAFPWTPLWVDLTVIAVAVVVALVQAVKGQKKVSDPNPASKEEGR